MTYRWKWNEGVLPEDHPMNGWHEVEEYPHIHSVNVDLITVEVLEEANEQTD